MLLSYYHAFVYESIVAFVILCLIEQSSARSSRVLSLSATVPSAVTYTLRGLMYEALCHIV